MVRNGAIGGVASSGLFVIRADQSRVDPHYLLAYLDSNECHAWAEDHARGATIQHLSNNALRELPVPLPPIQIQQRIAEQYKEHGIDVLAYLVQLYVEGEKDPIAEWVATTLRGLPPDPNAINQPLDLIPLQNLATEAWQLRNQAAHAIIQSSLTTWFLAFAEALSVFRKVKGIPRGPGLLSLLQEAAQGLARSGERITSRLPVDSKARTLNDFLLGWVKIAINRLLTDVNPTLTANVTSIGVGESTEIELNFFNRGSMPMRGVSVLCDWGGGEFDYVGENSAVIIRLKGEGPKKPGTFNLKVLWQGLDLYGNRHSGEQEIAFAVEEIVVRKKAEDFIFGGSPYICGDPVRPERNDVFFGREELLEQIRRQVIHSGNVILLEGNRRSGKSSILWHLEGPKAIPGWFGVYCSLQGAQGSKVAVGVPTVEIFREMATCLAKSLRAFGKDTPLPNGTVLPAGEKYGITKACHDGITEESYFSNFRDYLEVALDFLGELHLNLLLLLDEFDKLQEGIDSGVTSKQVPENIRYLVQTYPRFSTILTGSRRLKRLREEYWSALYGLGTRFGVTSLEEEPMRHLITDPVKDRLTYSGEAIDRVIYFTAGQPYLLQCLCSRIFNMAAQLKTRSVNLDLVNQASAELIKDNEHFASLWDYARSDRRRLILALCQQVGEESIPLGLGLIQERLLKHGIEASSEMLVEDLEFLQELELVTLFGEPTGGQYALAIPLMGLWIEKQQDFAVVVSKAHTETEDQHEQ